MTTKRQEVIDAMVRYYQNESTDQYGQLGCIDIYSICKSLGRDENGKKEYFLELETIVNVSTYGGRYGSYKGFMPFGCFKDKEVERWCNDAFNNNVHRSRNLNSW
jgi:hypothetical protein